MRGEDEMLSWAVIAETVHAEDALQLSKNENFRRGFASAPLGVCRK